MKDVTELVSKQTIYCFRFFNYHGQPTSVGVNNQLVQPVPTMPNIMHPQPLRSPQLSFNSRQCNPHYLPYQEHTNEPSPIHQLQNFGRNFENS